MTTAATLRGDLDFARQLTVAERSVAMRMGEALKADGATVEEWHVLLLLGDRSGIAMTEIAEYMMLRAPAITKVVDRLVSMNLVHRRLDDDDRRRVLVFATERGRHALKQWSATVERELNDIVTAIGREDMALLMTLLVRIAS